MVVNHLKCIWRLADMEERSGVLIQNEKHANKSVANHKPIFGFAGRTGTGTMQVRKICLTAAMIIIDLQNDIGT